jgi:hypothetical protein
MRHKSKLFSLILISALMFNFTACAIPKNYTETTKAKTTTAEKAAVTTTKPKTTEPETETETTLDQSAQENELKIKKFKEKIAEYIKYNDSITSINKTYNDAITILDEKRTQANKNNEYERAVVYLELIVDEYQKWINAISNIYVPELAKEEFNLYLDSLFCWKEFYKYMSLGSANFDSSKADNLQNAAKAADIKYSKERERVQKSILNEGEELGLTTPSS